MTPSHPVDRFLARFPALAPLGYLALLAALGLTAWMSIADMRTRQDEVERTADMLARLEGRPTSAAAAASSAAAPSGPVPAGSPFLEGQTVTVAGAGLLQRVTGLVTRLGGSVLSSQVEFQGAQAKDGYISLTASCEVEQSVLQQLLYEIEAGMPYLFVEQLVVQAPAAGENARMRVLLGISGLWAGGK